MKSSAVAVGLFAALLAVSVAAVGGIAADTTPAQTETPQETNATGTNASFGATVSSFMQASSAATEGDVENGMFAAALNRTTDPDERRAIVKERIEELETRQARLVERRRALDDSNGLRGVAIAAHVLVGASNLEEAINETERAARDAGVDTERLATLRANASDLTGREVAELARGLAGPVDTPGRSGERGPPGGLPGADDPEDAPGRSDRDGGTPEDTGGGPDGADGDSDDATDPASSDDDDAVAGDDADSERDGGETGNDNSGLTGR